MEKIEFKRVACLYRVSTKAQVDKLTDDIPMQQIACADFIKTKPNWKLEKEYIEKGVSGYKKTALERDVLQQIKADALNKLFDILLVFMFDRLGRREDETPFTIQWLVGQGVEVWSVNEGQQRFDNRTDILMSFLRSWISGGESEKTGIRVKEKHSQMIKEGKFCGGIAPYGYRLSWSDMTNNKGRQLKKIAIDEEESRIVKLIYKLATIDGYGGHRIAMYLNENNILTRKGSKWGLTVVNYMLRNPIYKGYPAYGKTTARSGKNKRLNPKDWLISEVKVDELAIIDEDVWQKAQIVRKSRTPKCFDTDNINYDNYPQQTKSPLLFIGFIKCGYCGSTMCTYASVAKWYTKKDGTKRVVKPAYRCTSVNRGVKCEGQITYTKNKIEEPVLEQIYHYLDRLEKTDLATHINKIRNDNVKQEEKELKALQAIIQKKEQDFKTLQNEIVKAINRESNFTTEQLSAVIMQNENERFELERKEERLKAILAEKLKGVNKIIFLQNMIPNWKEEFDKSSVEVKKMLVSELIQEVVVYRNTIEVLFKVTMDNFI